MWWRAPPGFAKQRGRSEGAMSPESVQLFFALAIGFAVAGMLATGYQLVTSQTLSFRVLESGPKPTTFVAVPILVFAAPFLIMRNTIRGHAIEGRSFQLVMASTVVAGIWSLMSGSVAIMAVVAMLQV
jgi:hypothetical protein